MQSGCNTDISSNDDIWRRQRKMYHLRLNVNVADKYIPYQVCMASDQVPEYVYSIMLRAMRRSLRLLSYYLTFLNRHKITSSTQSDLQPVSLPRLFTVGEQHLWTSLM